MWIPKLARICARHDFCSASREMFVSLNLACSDIEWYCCRILKTYQFEKLDLELQELH